MKSSFLKNATGIILSGLFLAFSQSPIPDTAAAGTNTQGKTLPKQGGTESSTLKNISPVSTLNSVSLSNDGLNTAILLHFDSGIPIIKPLREEKGDLTIVSIVLIHCLSGGLNLSTVVRPMLHMDFYPVTSEPFPSQKLDIYLEKPLKFIMERQGDSIISIQFPWIRVKDPMATSKLEKIFYHTALTNRVAVGMAFDDIPSERHIFLSKDSRKLIILLHNAITESLLSKPNSPFMTTFTQERGFSLDKVPYFKFVLGFKNEVVLETRQDNYRIFAEVYDPGLKDKIFINDIGTADYSEEEADEYTSDSSQTQNEKGISGSANNWVLMGIGAGLILGGTSAYMIISSGSDGVSHSGQAPAIPSIQDELPPFPTP